MQKSRGLLYTDNICLENVMGEKLFFVTAKKYIYKIGLNITRNAQN